MESLEMAVLSLLRHAKAAQPLPSQQDFDRPLTERGRNDAAWAGRILAGFKPGLALVSAAQRTRETWDIASQGISPTPDLALEQPLYLCSPAQLLARLQAVPANVRSVVAVGHNPCMHELAVWLARNAEEAEVATMREKFPTAALAIFDLRDGGWSRLSPESVALRRFATPKMGD
jgi:phosphohistidine phosphatase